MMTDASRSYDEETVVLLAFNRDPTDTTWQKLGACRGADWSIFFPTTGRYDAEGEEIEPDYPSDEAKAICNRCPVKDICLSWALKDPSLRGIWGGTSTYQREQMRRRRARKTCPGCTSSLVIESSRNQLCLACGASWPV